MSPMQQESPDQVGGATPGLHNDRYRVLRELIPEGGCRIWEVRQEPSGQKRWALEFERGPGVADPTWAAQVARFLEVAQVLVHLEHPNLVRARDCFTSGTDRCHLIVDPVQGLPLDRLCEMSQKGLSTRQVGWFGQQLCDVLAYLHDRPVPVLCLGLSTSGIRVREDESLQVVDFGLARIFRDADLPTFVTQDREALDEEIQRLGRVFEALVQCSPTTGAGVTADPALRTVIRRCVDAPRSYAGITPVREALDEALGLGRDKAANTTRRRKPISLAARVRANLLPALATLTALVAISVAVWWLHGHRPYQKAGPVAYLVVSGNALVTLQVPTGKVLDHRTFDIRVGDVSPDGQGKRLFLADLDGRRVLALDATTNGVAADGLAIPVEGEPVRMACDHTGSYLFVLTSAGNISRINLTELTPRVESVLSVSDRHPSDMIVSRDSRTLYLVSAQDRTAWGISSRDGQVMGQARLSSTPTSLSLSGEGHQLWVLGATPESLTVLATDTFATTATVNPSWGIGACEVALSSSQPEAYVACRQGRSVVVLDSASQKMISTISLPARPMRVTTAPDDDSAWVVCEDGEVARVRHGDPQASVLTRLLARPSSPLVFAP